MKVHGIEVKVGCQVKYRINGDPSGSISDICTITSVYNSTYERRWPLVIDNDGLIAYEEIFAIWPSKS